MKFDTDATEIVTAIYKGMLGRQPDEKGLASHVKRLKESQDLPALLKLVAGSGEFRKRNLSSVHELIIPLWSDAAKGVATQATSEQFELLFERIRTGWTKLGETEPHWSVVTHDLYKAANFAKNEDSFYKTGETAAAKLELLVKRSGLKPNPDATILELGCGTGRVTHALAEKYARVVAVDVSPGNLRLCEEKMRKLGKENVEFILLNGPRDIERLPAMDIFYSIIVLQHNPPPVIHYILDQVLGKVRKSGLVYFQVPTHDPKYSFDIAEYLASPSPGMEMHCLPMPDVFSLLARRNFRPIEVLMDAGINRAGSHTFFAVRE